MRSEVNSPANSQASGGHGSHVACRFRRYAPHAVLVLTTAGLAVYSLLHDSITFDETKHFASGLSYLKTGDYRLSPDTPPSAQMIMALPALLLEHDWPPPQAPGWQSGDVWKFGPSLLYDYNDGTRWILPARYVCVLLLLITCVLVCIAASALFGHGSGLLALWIACLSPTLLAHGRLVTTDLPISLAFLACILAYARLLKCLTPPRLLVAIASISIASLVKFSWPVIIPPLAVMGVVVVTRREPLNVALPWVARSLIVATAWRKILALLAVGAISALGIYLSIWSCYGWRFSPFRGPDADVASMIALGGRGIPAATQHDAAWRMIMQDPSGQPLTAMLLT